MFVRRATSRCMLVAFGLVVALAAAEAFGQATGGQAAGASTRPSGQVGQGSSMFSGPQLGTVGQDQLRGLGAGRVDRSGRSAVNPLATRGTESLRGLGAGGDRAGRTNLSLIRGGAFGGAGRFGFGTTRLGARNSRTNRPQYVARVNLPAPARRVSGRPGTKGLSRADDRIRKAVASLPGAKQVQVLLADGGLVVLRGTVPTERERRLAELMAKLQPGVKRVKNELRLQPPAQSKPASTP